MNDKKCAICEELMDSEHPDSIYIRNPKTFRLAWLHRFCFDQVFGDLIHHESSKSIYLNRQDEYLTRFE